jgi:hypothetical protein
MNVRNSSIARESIVIKDDEVEELVPKGRRSNKVQIIQESSEDDEPIAATRQCHDTRPSIHADTKPLPKKFAIKAVKKTVQSTYVSKPIMKNDIKAKKGVVKEIESYWGKGFIKSHIPKCHRPLVSPDSVASHIQPTDNTRYLPGQARHARQALGLPEARDRSHEVAPVSPQSYPNDRQAHQQQEMAQRRNDRSCPLPHQKHREPEAAARHYGFRCY